MTAMMLRSKKLGHKDETFLNQPTVSPRLRVLTAIHRTMFRVNFSIHQLTHLGQTFSGLARATRDCFR